MGSRRTGWLGGALPLVLLLACFAWSAPAHAHAGFVGGDPGSEEILSKSPGQIRLTFSEPVEAEFDPVQVTGPDGERVDGEDARVSPEDARVIEASLEDLQPGTYRVEYRVTSVDGHVISDGYEFQVSEPLEGTTPDPSAAQTTGELTRETLPETEPASGESAPFGNYALAGLLVLGLAALGVFVVRSRGRL